MTDVSVLLCTTIKRASRWARSDAIWCSLLSWNPPRLVERYPAVQSDQKKKKKRKFFGFPRPHDSLISRRPLQGLVGNIRGEASSPSRREDTQGEHWQARWTPGRPISPSSVKCELFDKIDEGSRGREGGRVCAGRRVGRGRGGVCACASHYAKLFDPWFNISTELSSLSLFICPPLLFSLSISVVDVVVYTEREYVSGVWKSGTEMMPVNF